MFYTLKPFRFDLQSKHIKKFSSNTTAVAVINKMGTCRNHAFSKPVFFAKNFVSGLQLPIYQARKI